MRIAELGVLCGDFTHSYRRYLISKNIPYEIYLIDIWDEGENYPHYKDKKEMLTSCYNRIINLLKQDSHIHIIKQRSDVAYKNFENKFFDWVYIDADHSYEAVKADILNWTPKIKSGGLLSGHDFLIPKNNPRYESFGVKQAVEELFDNFKITDEGYWSSWYTYIE